MLPDIRKDEWWTQNNQPIVAKAAAAPRRTDLSQDARLMAQGYAQAFMSNQNVASSAYDGPVSGRFGPGFPVMPTDPEERPSIYQYRTGENLVYTPRAGYGLVSFQALRNLADVSKEVRLNIELIKRQVRGLRYQLTDVDTGQAVSDVGEIKDFLDFPDGEHDFDAWINELLEELLVTDAVTLYPTIENGRVIVELVDGTTIRPLIDFYGRTPRSPLPAYLQILHGVPTSWYTRERLIYRPLNTSVYSPYGKSPTEFILAAVNLALRRDSSRITTFTDGNVPAAFAGLPETWQVEQIAAFTEYFNALVQGDQTRNQKVLFLPHTGAGTPVHEFNQSDVDKVDLDTWLMQLACWAFGNSPSEFGITPGEGLGGKGFAEGGEATQYRTQIGSIAEYLERLFNFIYKEIHHRPDLRLTWTGLEPVRDREKVANVDEKYIDLGIYSREYVQHREGIPPEYRPENPPSRVPGGFGAGLPSYGYAMAPGVQPVSVPFRMFSASVDLAKVESWPKGISAADKRRLEQSMAQLEPAMRRALGSQAQAILKRLKGLDPQAMLAEIENPVFWGEVRLAAEKILREKAFEMSFMGVEAGAAELSAAIEFALPAEGAQIWATEHAAELVTGIDEVTRSALREAIAKAMKRPGGVDSAALSEQIGALLDTSADYRARMIAQTETVQAYHNGKIQSWYASGVVWGKEWVAGQAGACKVCRALHGQAVALGEAYRVTVDGKEYVIPEGELAHPHDRCSEKAITRSQAIQRGLLHE